MSGQTIQTMGWAAPVPVASWLTVGWIISAIVTIVFVTIALYQITRPLASERP
jgi:hypothetical protein